MKRINILLAILLLIAIAVLAVACTTNNTVEDNNNTSTQNNDPRNQIYLSAVSAGFEGTYEEWLNSIKGDSIELKVADGYIQMKYKNDSSWTNLLQLDTLKGQNGVSSNTQMQVANGYIQWKNDLDNQWTNLVAISDLTGEKGSQIELNVANGYINYKYEDDTDWTQLIQLTTLTGANGKEVEFRVNDSYLQWKYSTDDNWNNLYEYVQIDTYVVTFVTNTTETENPLQQNIKRLSKVVKPDVTPTKAGYTFAGWYYGDEQWSFKNSVVTENMELQAHWNLDKCTLTIDNQATGVIISGNSYENKYDCGAPILLRASSFPTGYTIRWELDDNYLSSGEYCVFTAPNQNATIKATLVPEIDNNKVYLGSYPQTRITDTATLAELETLAGTLPTAENSYNWTGYGYDTSNDEYMWYQDVEYNGNKYRGVYLTLYKTIYGQSSDSFNSSKQRTNGYNNYDHSLSNAYWFIYEPIEWDVLKFENGYAMLISNYVINTQVYSTDDTNKNNYELSRIRTWLNDTFYSEAFSAAEKVFIQETNVDNSAATTDSTPNPYACNDTLDKVYLLSYQEANEEFYHSDAERQAIASDYARCEGVYCATSSALAYCCWMLRSPINNDAAKISYVDYDGNFNWHYYYSSLIGIRPVIWVKV